jgi:hypothetical protein
MLPPQLSNFWRWLNSPPSAPPGQTQASIAGTTEDPTGFSEQLRRLQDSLHEANQPVVAIENTLRRQ